MVLLLLLDCSKSDSDNDAFRLSNKPLMELVVSVLLLAIFFTLEASSSFNNLERIQDVLATINAVESISG